MKYTSEMREFIHRNYRGTSNEELMSLVNEYFGTDITIRMIKSYKANHKLNSGLTGRFEKGHIPANKGTKGMINKGGNITSFKKGSIPANCVPIGTERETKDYIYVKVQNGKLNKNWKLKHVKIWEDTHGKLPCGHIVIFLDGNNRNFNPENLRAIKKATNARLNQNHLRYKEKEITEAGIMVAELLNLISEKKKRTV